MNPENDRQAEIRKEVEARVEQERAACECPEKPFSNPMKTVGIHDLIRGGEQACGLIFADLHADQFIFCATSEEWFCWQGHHWQRDTTSKARAAVEGVALWLLSKLHPLAAEIAEAIAAGDKEQLQYLQRVQREIDRRIKWVRSEHGRSSTLSFAAFNTYNPLANTAESFDRDPMLLACKNCVVNLVTGEGPPGRQDELISLASPIDWPGLDKYAPSWKKFIDEITLGNSDLEKYLQRLAGYMITGDVSEHIFPVFYGGGRNGKGTFIETIKYVLGPLAGALPPEMLLDQGRVRNSAGPSPDIMQLKGLRLAFASESDDGRKFSASAVKRFTGGDTLTGRNPHDKHPTTFSPTHKIVLICNDKPRAPANDYAFWRRMHLIPFNATFVEYDPQQPNEFRIDKQLPEKLKAEASGILAWLVRGCLDWQQRGLDPPAAVRDATAQYQAEEDLIGEWLAGNCVIHESAKGTAKDLYSDFSTWWTENISNNVMSQKRFGSLLGRRFERVPDRLVWYRGVGLFSNWNDLGSTGQASGRESAAAADDAPF